MAIKSSKITVILQITSPISWQVWLDYSSIPELMGVWQGGY